MKKITIALMMLLGAIAANAQTWVGGGISLDVSKTDGLRLGLTNSINVGMVYKF